MKFPLLFTLLSTLLLIAGCKDNSKKFNDYSKELKDWQKARLERLKSKTGWLNLAGLFWLEEGSNSFGSDSSNKIVFPTKAGAFLGTIIKDGDNIFLKTDSVSGITVNGQKITDNVKLKSDASGKADVMEAGDLGWTIIKRENRYALRLRDYNHPRISQLESIPCYESSLSWKINAKFEPFDSVRMIPTATMIGTTEQNICTGIIVFSIGSETYHLLPFSEEKEFFIIFGDKTNGFETYGNGRFMYASLPDSANNVVLDFNKAYNPPCAFSPFATCPMPPRENILDVEIKAGEKEIHLN